ncbi:alpha/beta hydrolase [Myxococcaceae bacterium GXIMD 01537]
MPFADINGQGIWFEDSGGPGKPLILAHGMLMDGRMFDAQVEALAPEFRVIRWDARALGRTRWDNKPFTLWDSAADCVGLMDQLGIRDAVVGGMSQGGYCALRVALRWPERVRALVLMSTRGTNDDAETLAAYRQTSQTWDSQGPIEPLVQGLAGVLIGDPAHIATWLPRWRELPRGHFVAAMRNLIERDDIGGRLGDIRCPAIVFHGLADHGVPPVHGEHLHATLPGSVGYVPVPGAAHAANLTHPEVVNPPLVQFLRAHA